MKRLILSLIVLGLTILHMRAQDEVVELEGDAVTEEVEAAVEELLDSTEVVAEGIAQAEETEGAIDEAQIAIYDAGKAKFGSACASCHTIGKGKLTGPDLKGVTSRLEEDWIISFVKSSTAMIQAGDEYAVKVFNDHNKTIMPDHPQLTDDDVRNILGYVTMVSDGINPHETGGPDGGLTTGGGDGTVMVPAKQALRADDHFLRTIFIFSAIVIVGTIMVLTNVFVQLNNK